MKPNCYCIGGDDPHYSQDQVDKMLADQKERLAKLCEEWARICESGRRHGCKVGARECARLIRECGTVDYA